MAGTGTPFPVSHKNLSLDIMGNKTDLVICSYDDHFLVIATQIGSMGTILHARKEEGMLVCPTFNVSVLFGKRDEPIVSGMRSSADRKYKQLWLFQTIVLSVGLKDHSAETLKGIVHAVIENRLCGPYSIELFKWAVQDLVVEMPT